MTIDSPLTDLKGVGAAVAKRFAALGVQSVGDLINYYPRRYEDYSVIAPIASLKPGTVTIKATIKQSTSRYVRRGMHITEAIASDDSGSIRLIWFNQPYREAHLSKHHFYYISGPYELRRQRFTILNPSIEPASDFPVNTARIISIYKETKGVTSRQIRQLMQQVLPVLRSLPESMPASVIAEQDLMSRAEAYEELHLPTSTEHLARARHRLGFEEVLQLSLASLMNRQAIAHESALSIPFDELLAKTFVKHLPFVLTNDQRRAVWQIYQDLQKTQPMNRLVEGDVGSGKTVIAAMAAVMVIAQGWQVALMAPTELLARQHERTLRKLLAPLGKESAVELLVGSLKSDEKNRLHESIHSGTAQFIVGTHALIQDSVDMHKLALIIIDEQHRFGVEQRKTLMAKAGHMPHVLSLTATPIPRSLALTLYGELDISLLTEKPVGRIPIVTHIESPNSRQQLYEKIDQELELSRQLYVVCPLITESASIEARSAEEVYEEFNTKIFRHRRVGLLHGKLKAEEKQRVMEQFISHELDILVATTVIEVGVDVPNASVMLIESAERFGLAQLHQLRGRVGRGNTQSYCYLMLTDSKPPSRRLRAMESSNDGFKLAELDLELRGPGAIYGTDQHGQLDLRIARLTDVKLIAAARQAAETLLQGPEDLVHYTQLMKRVIQLRAVTNLN